MGSSKGEKKKIGGDYFVASSGLGGAKQKQTRCAVCVFRPLVSYAPTPTSLLFCRCAIAPPPSLDPYVDTSRMVTVHDVMRFKEPPRGGPFQRFPCSLLLWYVRFSLTRNTNSLLSFSRPAMLNHTRVCIGNAKPYACAGNAEPYACAGNAKPYTRFVSNATKPYTRACVSATLNHFTCQQPMPKLTLVSAKCY